MVMVAQAAVATGMGRVAAGRGRGRGGRGGRGGGGGGHAAVVCAVLLLAICIRKGREREREAKGGRAHWREEGGERGFDKLCQSRHVSHVRAIVRLFRIKISHPARPRRRPSPFPQSLLFLSLSASDPKIL